MTDNEPGVVLHVSPFTDSKKILTLLTPHHGRIKVVWRAPKKSATVKIFTPCVFRWSGRGEMKTLLSFDELKPPVLVAGRALYCGMYLNEICTRVLPVNSSVELIYEQYLETLEKLAQSADQNKVMEILLRRFEFSMLNHLGLGINFYQCSDGNSIEDDESVKFRYVAECGFVREISAITENANFLLSASQITAIREERWHDSALKAAKLLARLALHPLLGDKPLKSRELFT